MAIHATALVSARAEIDPSVEIGPHVIIDGSVTIGKGTKIYANAYITGTTTIGENNEIHMGAVIGHEPQDVAFDKKTTSFVSIGNNNIIREYCTIHRGSKPDSATRIGSHNFLMAGVHLGHAVQMGDRNIIANNALLAGHVSVGNRVVIGGGSVFHQFLRIGDMAGPWLGDGAPLPLHRPVAALGRTARPWLGLW